MEFEHRPVLRVPTVDALLESQFDCKAVQSDQADDQYAQHVRQGNPQHGEPGVQADKCCHSGTQQDDERRQRGIFVDATFGRGGHSRALLSRLKPEARLVVFDKDPSAIACARQLAQADARVSVVSASFAQMTEALNDLGITQVDGIMLDLGVSSPQLDDPERGFSFMREGPLDMRMDTTQGLTAAQWLAQASVEEMREVIAAYGEERFALQIAKTIATRRETGALRTTRELAELIAGAVRTREKGQHPATRTFQALRIYLNRELEELACTLASALTLLAPMGRLAVISFHSLEDRMVKQCMARAARPAAAHAHLPLREAELPQPLLRLLGRVFASEEEIATNPRARSAVLRVAERTDVYLPPGEAAVWVPADPLAVMRARRSGHGRRVGRSMAKPVTKPMTKRQPWRG